MKVNSYSFAASAVAFSATVLALPTLFRRIDGSRFPQCFGTAIATGKWSTDCATDFAVLFAGGAQQHTAVDVGIIQTLGVVDLIIDFFKGETNSLSLSSTKLSGNLLSVPGWTWKASEAAQH
ncbi:hypothetical protein BGX34_005290, partial [Mortierella sp. NVP85]